LRLNRAALNEVRNLTLGSKYCKNTNSGVKKADSQQVPNKVVSVLVLKRYSDRIVDATSFVLLNH
jgi:hypothetical protein